MKLLTTAFILVFSLLLFSTNMEAAPKKMVAVILLMDTDDDQQIVETIYTSLMAAEKVAKVLNIEMISQDEVDNDVFVFALKSQEQKELTMKMFDEEGYELAAHRVLKVEEGNNYRALNVKSLQDGTYTFQLISDDGAELKKKIIIRKDDKAGE